MSQTPSAPLEGRGIVVTRPREQAGALATLIADAGGRPLLFPTIEIAPPADTRALDAVVDRLDEFDIAVFVSPAAADRAVEAIRRRRELPARLTVAAVGSGTARALSRHGFEKVAAPSGSADSEALLELPELASVGRKRVVIFRGDGGRELVAQTLTARGASVEYAQCYRRRIPDADASTLVRARDAGDLDALVVTSSEGMRNLQTMLGADAETMFDEVPMFVPHPRIAATARDLAVKTVVETGSGDESILRTLVAYLGRTPR